MTDLRGVGRMKRLYEEDYIQPNDISHGQDQSYDMEVDHYRY
jgi:hypothetical protein